MAQGAVLVARMSAKFTWEGQPVFIAEGCTTIREGHPMLAEHAELFKPLVLTFEFGDAPAKAPADRSKGTPAGTKAA
jgi:hypothetical protein